MLFTFPMPETPCMDLTRGSPSLAELLTPIVGDVAITWRKARPSERPGYIAPQANAKPPVDEAVPPACYALDVDAVLTATQTSAVRAAFAAWAP